MEQERKLTKTLDVEEVYVVGGRVDHGPESHRVSDLPVEPNVFVCREEPLQLRTDNADDVSKHGNEDQTAVEGKDETSASGRPDGESEAVEDG
jgi:hypothetical protein